MTTSKRAQYVFDAINETVSRNQEQLHLLGEAKNHWEKWFQVELATTLSRMEAKDIALEYSECGFDSRKKNTPNRTESEYKTAQIDIVFRRKLESKGKLVGIELKQTRSVQGIKSMLSDMVKINALKGSDWPFRELYFVLLCYEDDRERRKYGDLLTELTNHEQLTSALFSFESVPQLQCLVVYWEPGNTIENMSIESYKKWYAEIDTLIKKYELTSIAKGKTKKSE